MKIAIVVIFILSLLMTHITMNFPYHSVVWIDVKHTAYHIRNITSVIYSYQEREGKFPKDLNELVVYKFNDEESNREYVLMRASDLFDPWGNEYVYLGVDDSVSVYSIGGNSVDEGGRGDDILPEITNEFICKEYIKDIFCIPKVKFGFFADITFNFIFIFLIYLTFYLVGKRRRANKNNVSN